MADALPDDVWWFGVFAFLLPHESRRLAVVDRSFHQLCHRNPFEGYPPDLIFQPLELHDVLLRGVPTVLDAPRAYYMRTCVTDGRLERRPFYVKCLRAGFEAFSVPYRNLTHLQLLPHISPTCVRWCVGDCGRVVTPSTVRALRTLLHNNADELKELNCDVYGDCLYRRAPTLVLSKNFRRLRFLALAVSTKSWRMSDHRPGLPVSVAFGRSFGLPVVQFTHLSVPQNLSKFEHMTSQLTSLSLGRDWCRQRPLILSGFYGRLKDLTISGFVRAGADFFAPNLSAFAGTSRHAESFSSVFARHRQQLRKVSTNVLGRVAMHGLLSGSFDSVEEWTYCAEMESCREVAMDFYAPQLSRLAVEIKENLAHLSHFYSRGHVANVLLDRLRHSLSEVSIKCPGFCPKIPGVFPKLVKLEVADQPYIIDQSFLRFSAWNLTHLTLEATQKSFGGNFLSTCLYDLRGTLVDLKLRVKVPSCFFLAGTFPRLRNLEAPACSALTCDRCTACQLFYPIDPLVAPNLHSYTATLADTNTWIWGAFEALQTLRIIFPADPEVASALANGEYRFFPEEFEAENVKELILEGPHGIDHRLTRDLLHILRKSLHTLRFSGTYAVELPGEYPQLTTLIASEQVQIFLAESFQARKWNATETSAACQPDPHIHHIHHTHHIH